MLGHLSFPFPASVADIPGADLRLVETFHLSKKEDVSPKLDGNDSWKLYELLFGS